MNGGLARVADFRDPTLLKACSRTSRSGSEDDVSMIGQAVMGLNRDSAPWVDRGTYAEVLQELKLLWHVLVRCGRPLRDVKG